MINKQLGSAGSPSNENPPVKIAEEEEPLMVPAEAAEHLRISVATLLRFSRNGYLPGVQIGKLWRYRKSALDEWVRSKLSFFRHPCRERRKTDDEFAATVPERVPGKKDPTPRR